jgi:hypothetical protein
MCRPPHEVLLGIFCIDIDTVHLPALQESDRVAGTFVCRISFMASGGPDSPSICNQTPHSVPRSWIKIGEVSDGNHAPDLLTSRNLREAHRATEKAGLFLLHGILYSFHLVVSSSCSLFSLG